MQFRSYPTIGIRLKGFRQLTAEIRPSLFGSDGIRLGIIDLGSQQPAASSTQSQRQTPTAAKKPAIKALQKFCKRTISQLAARMPEGFVSLASLDHVERAVEYFVTVK
jgi:hypothetical protein